MKYMGSKNRIAKHILPIILKNRKEGQCYVEPFVGGGNMIDKVDGKRIGSDFNKYVIEALLLIRDNPDKIPDIITEDNYTVLKNIEDHPLRGFVGFAMSFGGKWFGGYRRDVKGTKGCIDNMATQTRRSKQSAIKQSLKIQGVNFIYTSYLNLIIPDNSIIYCDPPYKNTTSYKDGFNHYDFYIWCRSMTELGHTVYISEYNMPDDFECVWEKEISCTLSQNGSNPKPVEKLFTVKKLDKYHGDYYGC